MEKEIVRTSRIWGLDKLKIPALKLIISVLGLKSHRVNHWVITTVNMLKTLNAYQSLKANPYFHLSINSLSIFLISSCAQMKMEKLKPI